MFEVRGIQALGAAYTLDVKHSSQKFRAKMPPRGRYGVTAMGGGL